MPKYYAVKHGRQNGIYRTWIECQEQTKGFSGAIFKSFTTEQEALDFISSSSVKEEEKRPSIKEKVNPLTKIEEKELNIIEIYTDGSHQRAKNYLGIGAWCCYKNKEYSLSAKCDTDLLSSYGITDTVGVECSNPTAEFIAFAEVLKYFEHAKLSPNVAFLFHIDYIGIQRWMYGDWTAKEKHIQKIRDVAAKIINKMKIPIEIVHVKGHSGVMGNEKADALAGCVESFSNFDQLIQAINNQY
jgi:ribonuclease HI